MPRSVRLGARRSLLLLLTVALALLGLQVERATAEPRQTLVAATSSPDEDAAHAIALRDAADGESASSDSAVAAAKAADKRVEDLSQRTETTQIFANPDGSWLADESAAPVRVKQADGTWDDIDTTLVKVAGGFAPKAAIGGLTISDGGDTELASLTVKGKDLDWSWPTTLPTPVVEGNTATYRDVVANGDLVVTATPAGFKHELVLRQPPAQPLTIRMPVSTDGTALTEEADGGLQLSTRSGDDLVAAPNPTMHDASTDSAGASDNEVDLATAVGRSGNDATITLQPDQKYLTDPATQYPVTIDPNYYVLQNPSGDTWVYNTSPTAIHPNDDTLHVGTPGGGAKYRSYFQFATGSWGNGAVISSSTLRLRNFAAKTCSGGTVNLTRVTQSWAPGSLNWNNQPDITIAERDGSNVARGFSGSCPSDDVDWNATGIVQAWSNGAPNYGMRLAALDEGATNSYREFRSASYTTDGGSTGLRPRLLVYYNHPPNTPTNLTISGQSGTNLTTLRPTITATTSDTDGAPTAMQFDVYQGAGANPIYSGQGSQVNTSSGSSTAKIPAGVLSLGQTYTVKAFGWDGQYRSRASTQSASLTVTSPSGPPAPTLSPSNSSNSVLYTSSAQPTAQTTVNGSDSTPLQATFEVAASLGGAPLGSCTSSAVAPGTLASCALPSSAGLRDGETYFVRARTSNGYDTSTWSNSTQFVVRLSTASPPAAPTSISVGPCSSSSATVLVNDGDCTQSDGVLALATALPRTTATVGSSSSSAATSFDFEIRQELSVVAYSTEKTAVLVASGNVPATPQGSTTWTPGQELPMGTYNVRVRSRTSDTFSNWTTPQNFVLVSKDEASDDELEDSDDASEDSSSDDGTFKPRNAQASGDDNSYVQNSDGTYESFSEDPNSGSEGSTSTDGQTFQSRAVPSDTIWDGYCTNGESKYKILKLHPRSRARSRMRGDYAIMNCGKENKGDNESRFGLRHIREGHEGDFAELAAWEGTSWGNWMNWAVRYTMKEPGVRVEYSNNAGGRYCYERKFYFGEDPDHIQVVKSVVVLLGATGQRILTTFPPTDMGYCLRINGGTRF